MSTEKYFDDDENTFIRLADKFYLALTLTKLCSRSCSIFRVEQNPKLTEREKNCISKNLNECTYIFVNPSSTETCSEAIDSTYDKFTEKVKEALALEAPEEEEGEGEEDEE